MQETKKIFNKEPDQLQSLYLFFSQESLLLKRTERRFISKFAGEMSKDFNITRIEDERENLGKELHNRVNTLPVMSSRRFVILYCDTLFRKKTDDDKIVTDLLADLPSTTVLLIIVRGKINKNLKTTKTAQKYGTVVALNPPRYKKLDNWIKNEFKKEGKTVSGEVIKDLERMFNNELQRLSSEIEKIATFNIDKDHIESADIADILSRDRYLAENVVFSLTDALSKRNKKKGLYLLHEMITAGEQPLRILGNILWQIELLLKVKTLQKEGKKPDQIAGILNQHPYPVKKSYRNCRNFTEKELELIMERLLEANVDIVFGKYKKPEMALEAAISDLF